MRSGRRGIVRGREEYGIREMAVVQGLAGGMWAWVLDWNYSVLRKEQLVIEMGGQVQPRDAEIEAGGASGGGGGVKRGGGRGRDRGGWGPVSLERL